MKLTDHALTVAIAVRENVGSDVQGIGPDTAELVNLTAIKSLEGDEIRSAIMELEQFGLFHVSYCLGAPRPGIPAQLRDIAGVSILERCQQLLDQLGV